MLTNYANDLQSAKQATSTAGRKGHAALSTNSLQEYNLTKERDW